MLTLFLSHHFATRVLRRAMSTTSVPSSTRLRVPIIEGRSHGAIAVALGTCNGLTASTTEKDKTRSRLEHSPGPADRGIYNDSDNVLTVHIIGIILFKVFILLFLCLTFINQPDFLYLYFVKTNPQLTCISIYHCCCFLLFTR